ncbi:recombination repair protein 1 isoform X3 [Glossina fuscipes]|uniref:DNA-(apurinic or apyrimidinic site) endonuclease n=1 Tax=Glossina fuscipes TaxID=7396 RepID=A0A9C6DW38_9MUSC|nr:recombination repair protein 1 isoform X3 [Glossina fuscipes]
MPKIKGATKKIKTDKENNSTITNNLKSTVYENELSENTATNNENVNEVIENGVVDAEKSVNQGKGRGRKNDSTAANKSNKGTVSKVRGKAKTAAPAKAKADVVHEDIMEADGEPASLTRADDSKFKKLPNSKKIKAKNEVSTISANSTEIVKGDTGVKAVQLKVNKLNKGGVEKISKFNLNIEETADVNGGDDVEQTTGEIYEKANKKGSRKRKQASQVEEEVQLEDTVEKPATVKVSRSKKAAISVLVNHDIPESQPPKKTKRSSKIILEENKTSESTQGIADQQRETAEKPTTTKRSRKPSVLENTANEEERENVTKIEEAAPGKKGTAGIRSRKRAAPSDKKVLSVAEEDFDGDSNLNEDEPNGSKPNKKKKTITSTIAPLNSTSTTYNKGDFELPRLDAKEESIACRYNLKISSWNVSGVRAWLKKDGLTFLKYEEPDIFCMQEIKCTIDQLPEELERIPGYHPYWLCKPGGYAGVAIYSKIMPINVEYGIGDDEFDGNGRVITAEYEKFFLMNVYVPNSGRKLVNLEARMKWEKLFRAFVQQHDDRKPIIICGDMNVSHAEIDLANPKTNTRNAGFTKEEREKMTELLALGYIDTFRHFYPERKGAYTFWTYMGGARARNVGWRLDYFLVSQRFLKKVVDNCIRSQCMGSDHCPITLFLKL